VELGARAVEGVDLVTAWAARRVLVTGATGIVGSWLVRQLIEDGAFVVGLVRDMNPQTELLRSGLWKRITIVNGALEDYHTVERAVIEHEVDSVFHLAAQAIVTTALHSPRATFESNIRGTYNLLEACRVHARFVQRVVVASSDKAYGESPKLPYTEDMPLVGRHPYDVSKSCTDLISLTYAHTYRLPVIVARCGNIYGGGDLNWSRIVPGTIRSVLRNERPVIRSDGKFIRDYIYVRDVVDAYLALGDHVTNERGIGEAFNFSPESRVSVLEITREIQRLMNRPDLEPVILNQAKAEIPNQYLDSSKAARELGWTPRYSLEAGLRETIDWYRTFLGAAS
jgi:CDP-glucose 4,6-dehydratase